jgi:serine/threonine protein kinase
MSLYGNRIITNPSIHIYNPSKMKLFDSRFEIEKRIYTNDLSPSLIFKAKDLQANINVAVKQIRKDRLYHNYLHDFAKNEITLQHSLGKLSDNIAKVYSYFEDEATYTSVIEISDDPCYFEDLLDNVYFSNFRNIAQCRMREH